MDNIKNYIRYRRQHFRSRLRYVLLFGDENDISKLDLQAEKVEVKNKVGCGDIFGTVFFYSYLDSGNLENSLKSANKTAGFSVSINVLENPERLINHDRK